ncbi:MFS transporter [Amycolatopsis vastitatis]|uniref:MFS transporter n=1 Tax=Amycolatopsis vastitatis TaxID=1905142 RepID=A0A229TEV9_9PSEU|nr:MFS transporter [Amycolatopsis vastitatis]OXM69777.1 MFS transporter [Amycolatopsis vastitatis]
MSELTGTDQRTVPRAMLALTLAGVCCSALLAALDQTVVGTASLKIVQDIGGQDGVRYLPWMTTAYLLLSTSTNPLYGKVSDLYGRKPAYFFALTCFLVGSAFAGLAGGMVELIAARAVQGLGAGGLTVSFIAIVGDLVPPRERSRYMSLFVLIYGSSSVVGPLVGGFLAQSHSFFGLTTSWRWAFYVNMPFGVLAMILVGVAFKVPHRRREHRVDYLGAALLVGGLSTGLLAISWGGQKYPWTSPLILGLVTAAVVLLAAFLRQETRAAEPIVPLRLFTDRTFAVGNVVVFLGTNGLLIGTILYVTLFLQLVGGLGPTAAGLSLIPLSAGMVVSSLVVGRLIPRLGRYRVFLLTGTALATTGLLLLSTLDRASTSWSLAAPLAVVGLGIGSTMTVLSTAIQNSAPPGQIGVASSSVTFFQSFSGTVGTAVFGAILTGIMSAQLGGASGAHVVNGAAPNVALLHTLPPALQETVLNACTAATRGVCLVAAAVALAAFCLSWFVKDKPLASRSR